jgi:hypothetical protein
MAQLSSQIAAPDDSGNAWKPEITAGVGMAATLVALALAVAWLLTTDLNALPLFSDIVWHARLLFANFLIIVLALTGSAAWLLLRNAREIHALQNECKRDTANT